jgi:hypothetical protein
MDPVGITCVSDGGIARISMLEHVLLIVLVVLAVLELASVYCRSEGAVKFVPSVPKLHRPLSRATTRRHAAFF